VVSNDVEYLDVMTQLPDYGRKECIKEGFPDLTETEFVEMFCKHMRVTPHTKVNRIEFEHL
jgi:hypothetical protein